MDFRKKHVPHTPRSPSTAVQWRVCEEHQVPGRSYRRWPDMVHQHHLPSHDGTATPTLPSPNEESWTPPPLLPSTTFNRCAVGSILTSALSVWYSGCPAADRKALTEGGEDINPGPVPVPLPQARHRHHQRPLPPSPPNGSPSDLLASATAACGCGDYQTQQRFLPQVIGLLDSLKNILWTSWTMLFICTISKLHN